MVLCVNKSNHNNYLEASRLQGFGAIVCAKQKVRSSAIVISNTHSLYRIIWVVNIFSFTLSLPLSLSLSLYIYIYVLQVENIRQAHAANVGEVDKQLQGSISPCMDSWWIQLKHTAMNTNLWCQYQAVFVYIFRTIFLCYPFHPSITINLQIRQHMAERRHLHKKGHALLFAYYSPLSMMHTWTVSLQTANYVTPNQDLVGHTCS